jgi:hypothetical protein
VPRAKGAKLELVCNECGIVEGGIDGAILRTVVTSGLGMVPVAAPVILWWPGSGESRRS